MLHINIDYIILIIVSVFVNFICNYLLYPSSFVLLFIHPVSLISKAMIYFAFYYNYNFSMLFTLREYF